MIIIGLTGSIGMGKTTTANMLRDMGIPVHDADAVAHELMAKNGKAVSLIANIFPDALDKDENNIAYINRQNLSKAVLNETGNLKKLENILHPLIKENRDVFLKKHQKNNVPIVVLDIPLLFETKSQADMDIVFCVTAPTEIQKKRVMSRANMTIEKFNYLLSKQMSDADKREKSDIIIYTNKSLDDTKRQLETAINNIKKKNITIAPLPKNGL